MSVYMKLLLISSLAIYNLTLSPTTRNPNEHSVSTSAYITQFVTLTGDLIKKIDTLPTWQLLVLCVGRDDSKNYILR
jgi:putative component of membrane protein insertase Oxa1/YidC/SpoIIIJ protein YidD